MYVNLKGNYYDSTVSGSILSHLLSMGRLEKLEEQK